MTGERGVGKSALVGEFLRRIRAGLAPVTVVAGRCTEAQGPGEAFLPFLDAVGRLLTSRGRDQASELLRTYAPTVCVQMPAGLLPDPDGALHRQAAGATKERLIREGGDFMEAACRLFPIVLYLEDLQWADPASVDLLHHVGCRLARQRTLVVATFRQADVDAANPPLKRCVGGPPGAGGGPRAVARRAQRTRTSRPTWPPASRATAFPPRSRRRCTRGPRGSRSSCGASSTSSLERGDIVRDGKGWALARPVEELDLEPTLGLRELVRHQLEGLAGAEREILEVASVAGREFQSPVVAHLVGREERQVEEDLRRLCRVRRLLVDGGEETLPDGTLGHAIPLRPRPLRVGAARGPRGVAPGGSSTAQVASRLRHHWGKEAPRLAAEIARHCEEGHDPEGAIEFRRHAGDNAARLLRLRGGGGALRLGLPVARGACLPRPGRGRDLPPPAAGHGAPRPGPLRRRHGRLRVDARRVAREAGAGDAERAALAGLCDTLFFAQRVEEMAVRARGAARRRGRAGGDGAFAEAEARMGQVLVGRGAVRGGRPDAGERDRVRPPARPARGARGSALSYRGFVHYWQTEYAAAEALSVEAAALARERGDGFYALGAADVQRAWPGPTSAGSRRPSTTSRTPSPSARRNDDRYWLPRLASHLGWVHRELGALERARELDAEAVRIARERPAGARGGGAPQPLRRRRAARGGPERGLGAPGRARGPGRRRAPGCGG